MTDSTTLPLLQEILARLTVIESQLGVSHTASSAVVATVAVVTPAATPAVLAFDEYLAAKLDPFLVASAKLGGDADAGAKAVQAVWQEMRQLLVMSTQCKEIAAADQQKVFSELSTKMKVVASLQKRNEWERHLKTLSEGVTACNW
jgi:hypothetical protein